jgi:hypothetical protein
MEYLAALTTLAQDRAPDSARELLVRGKSVAAAELLTTARPRMR